MTTFSKADVIPKEDGFKSLGFNIAQLAVIPSLRNSRMNTSLTDKFQTGTQSLYLL
jgi:hypothetical protein